LLTFWVRRKDTIIKIVNVSFRQYTTVICVYTGRNKGAKGVFETSPGHKCLCAFWGIIIPQ
jgi:hypothetical protein